MSQFNSLDEKRHTAIYVRITTPSQKTDRQQEELTSYAELNQLNFNQNLDVFIDVVSGFKDEVERLIFSVLKTIIELGIYQQVLFREFCRLDRKPSNLLKDFELFQAHDCLAFFHKQNHWVGDKSDIGTQILIQVLAVMSQYEIELFTSRGIDGKISAIKNRKTTCGGFSPYGYSISEDSRLVINEDEAAVVRRIFSMYLHGEKTVNIKDTLNSEKIPCPYKARQDATNQRRKNKGLAPVEYKGVLSRICFGDGLPLRVSSGTRYISGYRPTHSSSLTPNPIPRAKRKGRKVIEKFEIHTPETRIISDEEFYHVDKTYAESMYNRNQGIRRPTMIKDLLRCGECGSHFCAVLKFLGRTYECAAKAGRIKVKCLLGPCVLMSKLDGLVLRLCIQKFAQYDLVKKSEGSDGSLFPASAKGRQICNQRQ